MSPQDVAPQALSVQLLRNTIDMLYEHVLDTRMIKVRMYQEP